MAKLIDGKAVAKKIKTEVAEAAEAFKVSTNVVPGLATVLVGDDPASHVYVRSKIRTTEKCGMKSFHYPLPADTSEQKLLELIDELNANSEVHGILVQLPLPKHIDENKVIRRISPGKDVDGLHPMSMGALFAGQDGFRSCTPFGVMKLLEHYDIDPSGKDVLVIGRSNMVGKPQAFLMLHANATVTMAHSRTKDLQEKVAQADIVVAAVGRAKFVNGDWLKDGAVVIDVGINRLEDGSLCGDVDFESAEAKASYITPVPGGVGPMTIAMLMWNTLQAAKEFTND